VRLKVVSELCTGCRICQSFCSFHHERVIWPAMARIAIVAPGDDGPFSPNVCRQCDDAPCAAACPVEAISMDGTTGAWAVDSALCEGCGACVQACPYDVIFVDEVRGTAIKCNLCGGTPECAMMCPTGAVTVCDRSPGR